MQKRTLPRHRGLDELTGGWAHPYGHDPFSPYLYADGGDGGDSGSDSGDNGDDAADDSGDDDAGGTGDTDASDDDSGKDDKPKPRPPKKDDGEDPAAELARLRKELRQANAEAAKARTSAKKAAADEARAEIMKEIGKVLGLVEDDKDTPPDPAKLTAEIEKAKAAHRETAVELAVYRGAAKYGADPEALTDSRAFMRKVRDLDPADEEFARKVSAAIKEAVADNPKLKAASTAPARSSGDFSGSTELPKNTNTIEAQREARRKARA